MKYYLLAQIVYGVHLEVIAFLNCQAPEESHVKISNNINNTSRDTKTSLPTLGWREKGL